MYLKNAVSNEDILIDLFKFLKMMYVYSIIHSINFDMALFLSLECAE